MGVCPAPMWLEKGIGGLLLLFVIWILIPIKVRRLLPPFGYFRFPLERSLSGNVVGLLLLALGLSVPCEFEFFN